MLAPAPAKKIRAEAEALLRLEGFLLDLVTVGLGGLTEGSARAIAEEARRLGDLDVTRGAAGRLRAIAEQVSPARRRQGRSSPPHSAVRPR